MSRLIVAELWRGGRQLFVARKHGDPFHKGEIGRNDGRPPLVPIGDQIEEQLAAHPEAVLSENSAECSGG
jgi:hypothetical protein